MTFRRLLFLALGVFGHYLPSNGGVGLYAIDVDMPMGTPVHAIRSGTVVAVEEGDSRLA
jgi:murein DD-endopeptidase MepM/ murein hydrolase activator NlpD